MQLSKNEGIEGSMFVVTGGLGFVGSALCLELKRRGAGEVRALDVRKASPWLHDLQEAGIRCIQGDVCQKKDVKGALRGADCVFHLAAYGMSGKEMLQIGRVNEVNVNGTCNVVDACLDCDITRLVYVSTYNVVFGGKEIMDGNETLGYFPLDEHVDPYGRSKSLAEQLVLKSSGRPCRKKNGRYLYTCAIRPAAIYGPGEERHIPRIISNAKLGLFLFKIGKSSVKTDWIYVDNLVLALILASMGLLNNVPSKSHPTAAGQPYFISDGSPVNTFEFFRPLLRSMGHDVPKISIGVQLALFIGKIYWVFYTMFYPWLNSSWLPHPLLLPAEVYKVGVTHYFSCLKAMTQLGYVPMVTPQEGMATTISYWTERNRKMVDVPNIYVQLFCFIGMLLFFYAAYLPQVWVLQWVNALSVAIFRSIRNVRMGFLISVSVHVIESLYSWHLAKRVDPTNVGAWFWQTLAFGAFSLRYLRKKRNKVA